MFREDKAEELKITTKNAAKLLKLTNRGWWKEQNQHIVKSNQRSRSQNKWQALLESKAKNIQETIMKSEQLDSNSKSISICISLSI